MIKVRLFLAEIFSVEYHLEIYALDIVSILILIFMSLSHKKGTLNNALNGILHKMNFFVCPISQSEAKESLEQYNWAHTDATVIVLSPKPLLNVACHLD